MLFDSITAFSLSASSLRTRGMAAFSSPAGVRTQNARAAPAPRKRPESVEGVAPVSSVTAIGCVGSEQSQGSPSF